MQSYVHAVVCSCSRMFMQSYVHAVVCSCSRMFMRSYVHAVVCSCSRMFMQSLRYLGAVIHALGTLRIQTYVHAHLCARGAHKCAHTHTDVCSCTPLRNRCAQVRTCTHNAYFRIRQEVKQDFLKKLPVQSGPDRKGSRE